MKQRLYDFIPCQASMRRDVFMWHSGRYPNRSSFSRLWAIIGLRTPSPSIYQQSTKQISGIVKDHAGIPVIGANVIVKGTTNGVITGLDGRFPTGSSGKRYLRDQLYRLYDAKYPDKRENDLQHHPRRRYAEIG